MRSEEEIENKFTQMGLTEVKNRDNYWYKIGYSAALLYCLGKEIEDYPFDYSDDDFEKSKELEEEISDFISDISTCGFRYDDRCPDNLDELQCCIEDLCNKFDNYKKILAEIQEIAEHNIEIADTEGLNGCYRRGLAKQILQKISEVENV